jgi:small subunit ribosomal protein S6
MFIISAETPETKREELIKQFTKMAGTGATVEKWGMRKFATPLKDKTQGFYVILNFTAEPTVPNKITALMNITDGVIRHLFIVKDDEMLAQDIIRKQNRLRVMANRADKPQAETEQTPEKASEKTTETKKEGE